MYKYVSSKDVFISLIMIFFIYLYNFYFKIIQPFTEPDFHPLIVPVGTLSPYIYGP